MDIQRVVITGLGAVTPIGVGVDTFWDALLAGTNGIAPVAGFDASGFRSKLAAEVNSAIKSAARKGLIPTFRLNGTTDIRWETIPVGDYQEFANIMEAFPTVQFYDYTKIPNRRDLPANYALTFSYSGQNGLQALWALRNGHNVAVVFRDSATATDALARGVTIGTDTFPVVNGDTDDLRFLDPASHIVALYAKGSAKSDTSGFVNDSPTLPVGSLVTLRASLAA